MLQYQTSEYCILIWDSESTEFAKALDSLRRFLDDGDLPFILDLRMHPFDQGSDDDKAKKILEEAAEVRAALQYDGTGSENVLFEICDTITACVNLASSLGYGQADVQRVMDAVEETNRKRGRYESE